MSGKRKGECRQKGKGEERGRPLNGCYGISQDFSWGPPAIFVCACILHAAVDYRVMGLKLSIVTIF